MPIPVAARMDGRIHSVLHLIQIIGLVHELLIVRVCYMGIERTNYDWNIWTDGVYSMFTQIIKFCKSLRWNIQKGDRGVLLHFLISTLDCISKPLGGIVEQICIVKICGIRLTDGEQYTNILFVVLLHPLFQSIST